MKVILLRDVAKLGKRFDIVSVPDGYGFNKLIPQNLALPATPENLKRVSARADHTAHEQEVEQKSFNELLDKLATETVTITAEANADGTLYQALKPAAIAQALSQAAQMTLLPERISTHDPVKHTGEHEVELSLGAKSGTVTITVVAK